MLWATYPACEYNTSDSWRSTVNKDFANWKRLNCWKIIIEFPARQWKWGRPMLFDLLRITESTGSSKRLSGGDGRRLGWTDSSIKSINNLDSSQDGQQVEIFSINFLTFTFCKPFFCHHHHHHHPRISSRRKSWTKLTANFMTALKMSLILKLFK